MYLCWISIFSDSESKYEKCIKLSDFLSSQCCFCWSPLGRIFKSVVSIYTFMGVVAASVGKYGNKINLFYNQLSFNKF